MAMRVLAALAPIGASHLRLARRVLPGPSSAGVPGSAARAGSAARPSTARALAEHLARPSQRA